MLKKLFPLLVFFTVIILYYPALFNYFSQDDFFHFKVSQTDGTLFGILNLFSFNSFEERGIAFYRPLSREVLFNLYYSIFGLNSIPFRILAFLIHFINIYLTFILVQKLFHNRNLSYFVTFFFGITAAHIASLYYLAGGIQTLLATSFSILSILFFQNFIQDHRYQFYLLALLTFILGIISMEQVTIIPLLLLGLVIIYRGFKNIKKFIKYLLPYFLISFVLIFIEIFYIGFSSHEQQYQIVLSTKTILNSFFWYLAWAIGVPETLIDFVFPGFKLNPNLLKYWSSYYIFIFPALFVSVILIMTQFTYLIIKKNNFHKNRFFLFAIFWFPLGLLPIILLPMHKSTHYLEISLPAFWIIIGFIALSTYEELKNRLLAKTCFILLVISLTILSSSSAILGSTNYWAATRGKIAEKLLKQVKNRYSTLPKGAVIYFQNDPTYPYLTKEWGTSSQQASIILNNDDALQLLYKDPSIQVIYESLDKLPDQNKNSKLYKFTAKIF